MLLVQEVEAKRANLRALARDSAGGKVLPLLRCVLLIGRPLDLRVVQTPSGPIGVRRQQAFHHVRTVSQGKKTTGKKNRAK